MSRIRVEHPDGSEDRLTHARSELIRDFGKMDLGSLWAPRREVNELTLQEDEDEVYFEDVDGNDLFGGVLKDVERGGPAVELVVDSFERYAKEAEPAPGGDRKENVADDTIVSEAISDVSELTEGTIEQIEDGLTFVFSHTTQAKKIRTVEGATSGEVAYNADRSVDYVDRIGEDKSDSITISPGNQNLDGKIKVQEKGGGKNISHLRMLGAGEGKHQLEVNIVPEDDPDDYENKATYESSWEEGDRKVWAEPRVNKEATDVDTLERQGLTLIEELNSSYVEVKATIKGVDVDFGDTVQVEKPKENIDQALRIVEWKRVEDNEGVKYKCTLSNRQKSRERPDEKNRRDLERYNVGFEGSPVTMTAGGGRQPVTEDLDYEFDFYYPAEVEYEHRVKLFVKGLAYRAYSQGSAAGGEHTHDVTVTHPEHSHTISDEEFNHTHDISVDEVEAEFHDHLSGSYGADSHGHSDGSFGADSHGHADGSFGADSHEHSTGFTETSEANTPHGSVVADGSTISFPGDSDEWDELESISVSEDYELGVIHVHATSAENPIEVRARDSYATSASDTSGDDENFTPRVEGVPLIGTSPDDGDATGTVTLIVPEDWGFVDVDYRSTGDPNTNISVTWMFLGEHTHDVFVGSPTGTEAPDITGDSGDTSPDVSGSSGDESPDVSGSSSSTSPGVSGTSDSTGGVRTSTTELGDTETETSEASGDHTHDPDPGVIETFDGTRHYPENCDVTVNGDSVGVSLGDGDGTFEEEVDLAGMLNPGQVNTVRISSESLGHLQCHLDIDVYRQILGDG